MADFVSVLRRAVENLKDNNEAARHALYGKARTALLGQLKALDPPLSAEDLQRQTNSLDAAIASLEAEYALAEAGFDLPLETDEAPSEAGEPPVIQQQPAPPPHRPADDLRSTMAAAERLGERPRPAGERRAAAVYDDAEADGAGGAGRYVAWIVLALVIIGIAGVAYWQRDTLATMVATLTGGAPADDEQKIVDRVPGTEEPPAEEQPPAAQPGATQPPAAQPPAAAPATPPAADSEGERVAQALLVEEGAGAGAPLTAGGLVDWSLIDDTDAAGTPSKVIEGQVRIPDKDLRLSLTIRRNLDQALPASHLVELVFAPGPNFPDGGITSVPGLLMKATPRSSGQPLVGAVVPVMEGYFLVGLSESDMDRERNIAEMRTRGFIDIPINYSNGGRAVLSLAKGETGTKVFQDAFAAWDDASAAAPAPPAQ